MLSMSLLITIGLTVLIVAVAAGLTSRSGTARPAVLGAGLAALVVGAWLTGATDLVIHGVASIVDWFQRTVFTTQVAWGVGLLVAGIVLAIIGALLPRGSKASRPDKAQPASAKKTAAPKAAPQVSRKQAQGPATQLDPEDAEIEELLRKRGIM